MSHRITKIGFQLVSNTRLANDVFGRPLTWLLIPCLLLIINGLFGVLNLFPEGQSGTFNLFNFGLGLHTLIMAVLAVVKFPRKKELCI